MRCKAVYYDRSSNPPTIFSPFKNPAGPNTELKFGYVTAINFSEKGHMKYLEDEGMSVWQVMLKYNFEIDYRCRALPDSREVIRAVQQNWRCSSMKPRNR